MKHFHYILDEDNNPVPENDLITWATWYEANTEQCRVGDTSFTEKIRISTVFLSNDHSFGNDPLPVLYETMVFASDEVLARLLELSEQDDRSIFSQIFGGVDIQKRYHTRAEAQQGHENMCTFIEICLHNGLLNLEG